MRRVAWILAIGMAVAAGVKWVPPVSAVAQIANLVNGVPLDDQQPRAREDEG